MHSQHRLHSHLVRRAFICPASQADAADQRQILTICMAFVQKCELVCSPLTLTHIHLQLRQHYHCPTAHRRLPRCGPRDLFSALRSSRTGGMQPGLAFYLSRFYSRPEIVFRIAACVFARTNPISSDRADPSSCQLYPCRPYQRHVWRRSRLRLAFHQRHWLGHELEMSPSSLSCFAQADLPSTQIFLVEGIVRIQWAC